MVGFKWLPKTAKLENEEPISFWVARGPYARKACSYSVKIADRLSDALIEFLGHPSNLDRKVATTAFCNRCSPPTLSSPP